MLRYRIFVIPILPSPGICQLPILYFVLYTYISKLPQALCGIMKERKEKMEIRKAGR